MSEVQPNKPLYEKMTPAETEELRRYTTSEKWYERFHGECFEVPYHKEKLELLGDGTRFLPSVSNLEGREPVDVTRMFYKCQMAGDTCYGGESGKRRGNLDDKTSQACLRAFPPCPK